MNIFKLFLLFLLTFNCYAQDNIKLLDTLNT
ncbi:MAG: hypothetical protein RLZZ500_2480, partial [Bacteroidota bacterium]